MTTGVWTFAVNGTGVYTYSAGGGSQHVLSQGAHTLNVRAVDASGNMGEASSFSLMVDSMAPTGGTLTLAADTGSSPSDGITSNGQINVTGLEGGTTTWEYSTDSGTTWTPGTGTSFTLAQGIYAANAVQVRQTDAAGFVQVTPATYAAQINVDTSNPDAPLAVYFSDDHGTSGSDWTTTSDTGASTFYVVSASGTRATWERAQYSTDGGTTWLNPHSTWFKDTGLGSMMLSSLPTTTTTYSFRVIDEAGNASSVITRTFTPSALTTAAATAGTFPVPSVGDGSTVIGSASDDIFELNQAGINNYLSQSTAYVEGHGGNDTLRLTGAGTSLNLLNYMNNYTLNKIQGMEFIDMSTDAGAQTLIGNAQAFAALTKAAWLNNSSLLGAHYQMVIKGTNADSLVLGKGDGFDTTGFTKTGTSASAANTGAAYHDGIAYDIWTNSALRVQLLVQQGIVVTSETNTTNAAPVLADTTLTMDWVARNAAAPIGAVGTLVSALVGGITDSFAASQKGIAITGVNTTNGTLHFSTDGGANWSTVTGASSTNALLLAADGDNRLYFRPNANYTGTVSDAITIRAWDRTSGADGAYFSATPNGTSTAFSTATDTVAQQVVVPVTINAISTDSVMASSEALVVGGTAAASATVAVGINGQTVNVTSDSSGNWTYDGTKVRYIMVRKTLANTSAADGHLTIGDVSAIQVGTGTNVAMGATQTVSNANAFYFTSGGFSTAGNIHDGSTIDNTSTFAEAYGINTSALTADGDAWVQLDLGAAYALSSIVVNTRGGNTGYTERTNGANIYASAIDMSSMTRAQLNASPVVNSSLISGLVANVTSQAFTNSTPSIYGSELGATATITAQQTVSGVSTTASTNVSVFGLVSSSPSDNGYMVNTTDNLTQIGRAHV
jgi:hypothetical protein